MSNPKDLPQLEEDIGYMVYQEEIGESGTYHLQGYIEFTKQKSMKQVKEFLQDPTAHIEKRYSTQEKAITYCTKEDTRIDGPYHFGTPKATSQGKRNDLEAFAKDVGDGKKKRELLHDHLSVFARYPKLYDLLNYKMPVRTEELEVTLLIGKTGVGKTRFVMDLYQHDPEFYICPLSNGTTWFDTYDGHQIVLLDDFAGKASKMTLVSLLRLIDRYAVMVPTKGSHTWWLPLKVFITTNYYPRQWYNWEGRRRGYDALGRRFTKVLDFPDEGGDPVVSTGPEFFLHNA